MSVRAVFSLLIIVASSTLAEDAEDDDISGPIMPAKAGGGAYNSSELIELRGYRAETALVTSADGYALRLFRVRPKAPAPNAAPVLLHHGLLMSSDAWLTDAGSLPFALSDAGHDVWLANARGNAYSRAHATLRPDADKAFWAFGWHEMGAVDLPAVVDHVLNATGRRSLHYVGHSLGSTVAFVMTSSLPAYRAKLLSLVALAPAVYTSKLVDMAGPDGMVQEMAAKYVRDLKALGKTEAFPRSDTKAGGDNRITCADLGDFRGMCEEKLEEAQTLLGGPYLPAGAPWRVLESFHQSATYGVVRRYNHSTPVENRKAYGGETPPAYALDEVTTPVLLYSTEFDQVIVPKDVDDLKSRLKNVIGDVRIEEPECFDHVTFVTARQKSCLPARQKVYKGIVDAFKKLDNA